MRTSNLLIIRSFILSVFFISLTLMMGCGSSSEKDPGQNDPEPNENISIPSGYMIYGDIEQEKITVKEAQSYVSISDDGNNTLGEEDFFLGMSVLNQNSEEPEVRINLFIYHNFLFNENQLYELDKSYYEGYPDLGYVYLTQNGVTQIYPIESGKIIFTSFATTTSETAVGSLEVTLQDSKGSLSAYFSGKPSFVIID